MMPRHASAAAQSGSFLLESLIAVLIVALGVMGMVGLLARSMQNIDDSKYRGEAAYLATAYIGQMWVADKTTLAANFGDSGGGAAYTEFKKLVQQRLPNATAPAVTFLAGPTPKSSVVQITLEWQTPGSPDKHQYQGAGTIADNQL